MKKRGVNVQPRTGETHGMFGVKFLKYHNIRDPDWKADDLITQYERLSNIYRIANRNAELQREQDEIKFVEEFTRTKEEAKKLQEKLNVLLKGDVQRTKNTFQDNVEKQRKYKNKQSYELKEELDQQSFSAQKLTDKTMNERKKMAEKYEKELMNVAIQQERVRYHDNTTLKAELEAKQLFAPLKNSETRTNLIRKENSSYKAIIDRLVHDALYFQPVWDALQSDWKEQTQLVQQVVTVGKPAIKSLETLRADMRKLQKVSEKEKNQQLRETYESRKILEGYPAAIKQLIRSPSDFSMLGDRYEKMTTSMLNLRAGISEKEMAMGMLKDATMCLSYEDILPSMKKLLTGNKNMKRLIDDSQKTRDGFKENRELLKFAADLLYDSLPGLYNEGLPKEANNLEIGVKTLEERLATIEKRKKMFGRYMVDLRYGLIHMVDVLRHVQSADFLKPVEHPTVDLKLPLRSNAPPPPGVVNPDNSKILDKMKSISQSLMAVVLRERNQDPRTATEKYQKAMYEDSMIEYRPT